MGAWSTAIFDDDSAADIRAEYRILLGYGLDPDAAWQLIYDYFYPDAAGGDEEAVFWFSAALFQWNHGILREDVKQEALKAIENGAELERWKDSGNAVYEKRKKVLEKLKDKLLNEVNPPKKIRKCPAYYREKTKFQLGDIFAYAHEDRKYSYIQVVEIGKMAVTDLYPELDYRSWSCFALLDVFTDRLLPMEELAAVKYRTFYITHSFDDFRVEFVDVIVFADEKQIKKQWIYLGNHDLLEARGKWHGSHTVSDVREYEDCCIRPAFSLPCGITHQMLNAALVEWLRDDCIETLEERLCQSNPEWGSAVVHAIKKGISRGVQMYVTYFRHDVIYERDPWGEEKIQEHLPWISNENVKRLLELLAVKVEAGELTSWENYLCRAIKY